MAGGSLRCTRCKNTFLPLSGGAGDVCPHCGAAVETAPASPGTGATEPADGWCYSRGGAQAGPVRAAELKRLAAAGELVPTDLVRRAGGSKWVPAGNVRDLFPEPPATAEPLPLPSDDSPPAEPVTFPTAPPPLVAAVRLVQARPRGYELLFALAIVLVIGGVYLLLARHGAPQASSGVGYALGVLGFLLMLSTETLYTLRKRLRRFTLWRMSIWLKIHIVTGIVGSCLVLLHSGGKFHGLAGILAALTVVIVISGFVGRYIYTAVPRTLDGVEVAVRELEEGIAETDRELAVFGVDLIGTDAMAIATEVPRSGWLLVLGRAVLRWRQRRRLHRALRSLKAAGVSTARLERLLMERYRLQMQIASLAMTRRLLALWHVMHIPLGAGVFTLAFIHIGAAFYYAALGK